MYSSENLKKMKLFKLKIQLLKTAYSNKIELNMSNYTLEVFLKDIKDIYPNLKIDLITSRQTVSNYPGNINI